MICTDSVAAEMRWNGDHGGSQELYQILIGKAEVQGELMIYGVAAGDKGERSVIPNPDLAQI
jgi:hypothetical protein